MRRVSTKVTPGILALFTLCGNRYKQSFAESVSLTTVAEREFFATPAASAPTAPPRLSAVNKRNMGSMNIDSAGGAGADRESPKLVRYPPPPGDPETAGMPKSIRPSPPPASWLALYLAQTSPRPHPPRSVPTFRSSDSSPWRVPAEPAHTCC